VKADPLARDLGAAVAFLALLDPDATTWTFQTFDDSTAKRGELARVLHGTLAGVAESLARLNAQGAGVFVTVNRTDGNGRKAANVTGVRSLFVDEDAPLQRPVALDPSIVVQADRGKHYYWKVAPGVRLDAFKPAQKHLISYYGSDPSVDDLPRVMRLPGFFHMKHGPKLVTLAGGNGKVYQLEEVLVAHPLEVAPPTPKAPPSHGIIARVLASSRVEALEKIVVDVADERSWTEGSRHASAKATAAHARKLDLPRDRTQAIVGAYLERAGKSAAEAADVVAWTFENVAPDPDEVAPRTTTTHGALALAAEPQPEPEPEPEYDWVDAPAEDYPAPLAERAYHGLAGRVVRLLDPHTEADPVAVLLQFLVAFGNAVGREAYFRVGSTAHRAVENTGIVGTSSAARKGTSFNEVRSLFDLANDRWAEERICSGLSSGEGLVWEVRDPGERTPGNGQKGKPRHDPGVDDKRLLAVEPELGKVLKSLQRDGQTLGGTMRELWDCPPRLRTMTKHSPIKATGPHVSIIGHITKPELLKLLDEVDAANGLGNRFLWALVRRSKFLPEGGDLSDRERQPIADELRLALDRARAIRQMVRDADAKRIWASVYGALTRDRQGVYGAVTRRAEAHTLRLSMIYSLLDGSAVVGRDHLLAALAVWDYCEASARCVFGTSLGDAEADEIQRALVVSPNGLTRTEVRDLFNRNLSSVRITRALDVLSRSRLARCRREVTKGRPLNRWFAITPEVPQ
jgi:hypothetical protein